MIPFSLNPVAVDKACIDLMNQAPGLNNSEAEEFGCLSAGSAKLNMIKGKDIDIQLSIKGRTFIFGEGRENFPDGEIFTGPVEDSVNGWIHYTYPAIRGGREVAGIELHVLDLGHGHGADLLVVDGAIPTRDGGIYCKVADRTIQEHLEEAAAGAAATELAPAVPVVTREAGAAHRDDLVALDGVVAERTATGGALDLDPQARGVGGLRRGGAPHPRRRLLRPGRRSWWRSGAACSPRGRAG